MKKPDFHAYYGELFDRRWPRLLEALQNPPHYHTLADGLLEEYHLDRASYLAASSLPLPKGGAVLDLCAAPGGKALVLALRMDKSCRLTVNEKSPSRRSKLERVLQTRLPEETGKRITVTGYDAAKWGLYRPEEFDAVLLDVPCSSERHILGSPKHLAQWSPARTKHLAIQAYAMLASAFMTVKPGCHILYVTCALSPAENDRVVEKLLKRKGEFCNVVPIEPEAGETTEYGIHILPDKDGGMGPLYYSLIKKNEKVNL